MVILEIRYFEAWLLITKQIQYTATSSQFTDKTIRSDEYERSDESIHEDGLSFFHSFFISTRSDIVVRTDDQEKYSYWTRKVDRQRKKPLSDRPYLSGGSTEISSSNNRAPYLYKSEKDKPKNPIDQSIFSRLYSFLIATRQDHHKQSPCKYKNCNRKDKDFEKWNDISERRVEDVRIPKYTTHNSRPFRWRTP